MKVTGHFAQRVRERIGEEVSPHVLASDLATAIAECRTDFVEYVGRQFHEGRYRRAFRFRAITGAVCVAITNDDASRFLTVFEREDEA